MTTIRVILVAARKLVAKGWTQGAAAKDRDGVGVDPRSRRAVCWCAGGAINAGAWDARDSSRAVRYLQRMLRIKWPLAAWNDEPDRTQRSVLAAFDRAIKRCRKSKRKARA